MTPAEVLSRARDVLAERGWHQGGYTNRRTGAVCLYGAVNVARGVAVNSAEPESRRLASLVLVADGFDDPLNIGGWNDAPERTYEDVIFALKHAEELAAAEVSA